MLHDRPPDTDVACHIGNRLVVRNIARSVPLVSSTMLDSLGPPNDCDVPLHAVAIRMVASIRLMYVQSIPSGLEKKAREPQMPGLESSPAHSLGESAALPYAAIR